MGAPLLGAESRLDTDVTSFTEVADTGTDETNITDDRIFTLYKMGSADTSFEIQTDAGIGNTTDVDYFTLIGHDLDDPEEDGLGGCDISFDESADGAAWTPIFSISGVSSSKIIARAGPQVTNRFFRIIVTRASAFQISIGQLAWGTAVKFPDGVPVGFDPNTDRIVSRTNVSQTGNLLGATLQYIERRFEFRLDHVPGSFVNDETLGGFKHFLETHGELGKPFLSMWNAENVWATTVFETDSFWSRLDPGSLGRSLSTQLAVGRRNVTFATVGLKEL